MKIKILGAAVATALLSVSVASFAQTGAAAGGQSNAGPGRDLQNGPAGRSGMGTPERGTTGNVITSPTTGASAVSRCDNLTGKDRTRCLRDERAAGGNSGNPSDQYPPREAGTLPGSAVQGTTSSGGSGSGSSQ